MNGLGRLDSVLAHVHEYLFSIGYLATKVLVLLLFVYERMN